jgi:hypothetical protein
MSITPNDIRAAKQQTRYSARCEHQAAKPKQSLNLTPTHMMMRRSVFAAEGNSSSHQN